MVIATFLVATAFLQQFPTADLPPKPKPDTVLAKVGGQTITAADVEPYLWDWLGAQAVQDLVSYKLVADEAAKHQVAVTEEEIRKSMDEQLLRAKESVPAGQDIDELLHDRAMPKSRIYLRVKADLLLTKLAVLEFKPGDYIKTSTFAVVATSTSNEDQVTANKKANEAYSRLQKGEAWEKVLRDYSTDPRVLSNNGALDWVPVSLFPASTQAELPQLKVGQVTKPVQTPNGIQIFRVDALGKTASGVALEALRQKAIPSLRKAVLDRLMKENKVERFPKAHG